MNRNSQLIIEILLFHQPVRPECQANRGKRWLQLITVRIFTRYKLSTLVRL